jgi:HEAT repeat protein
LISALKSKEYDAQVLIYALGKIPDENSAKAILNAMQNVLYGQEIRNTAQEALLEIGEPAIKPIIDGYIRAPDEQALLSAMLIHFGPLAVEPLIWAMGNYFNPVQCEAIINVLGEIGDLRAVNPLVDLLSRRNINNKLVNVALDKIWKKQRWEKERQKGKSGSE